MLLTIKEETWQMLAELKDPDVEARDQAIFDHCGYCWRPGDPVLP
jgi:hypothetical protein